MKMEKRESVHGSHGSLPLLGSVVLCFLVAGSWLALDTMQKPSESIQKRSEISQTPKSKSLYVRPEELNDLKQSMQNLDDAAKRLHEAENGAPETYE